MEIRSVTVFSDLEQLPAVKGSFIEEARREFHVPVQSIRIATSPFPDWWNKAQDASTQVKEIDTRCRYLGFDYLSLGAVQLRHDTSWLDLVPEIVANSDSTFVSAEVADREGSIDLGRCHAVAEVIKRISTQQADGFMNLYFAALANCPPGIPFFPVAYHDGGPPHFSVAVEAADLILAAIEKADTLKEARQNLISTIETEASKIAVVAEELSASFKLLFSGIDFTPAPFPGHNTSAAAAVESLGVPRFGAPGTLFGSAFIADAIDGAHYPSCGFSGYMLTVLEDSVLAERVAEGSLSISELLGSAAVCGIGLDTVPLPGDIHRQTLAGILADVAALAVRLDKPLTARLLPIPGLQAGDPVHFDFDYFADGSVLDPIDEGLRAKLTDLTRLQFNPIRPIRRMRSK